MHASTLVGFCVRVRPGFCFLPFIVYFCLPDCPDPFYDFIHAHQMLDIAHRIDHISNLRIQNDQILMAKNTYHALYFSVYFFNSLYNLMLTTHVAAVYIYTNSQPT